MPVVGIDLKGIGAAVAGLGSAAKDFRAAITGKSVVDPQAQAELEGKAAELEAQIVQAQLAINAAEAGNKSAFVSGWRPFLGWVGGLGFAYQFLVGPILSACGVPFVPLDMDALMTMLFGILGLGTMRTVEKAKGVAAK